MTIEIEPLPEIYLGDGLYAAFDGYVIRLRAPREDGDHIVYLEPWTLEQLAEFIKAETDARKRNEG